MQYPKLYMILLGCKPRGRYTEQHDVFFGIGQSLKELVPAIKSYWPEAGGNMHIDAWREVTQVDGNTISIVAKKERAEKENPDQKLFFLNLGGYKKNEFEEFHYKLLAVAENSSLAIKKAKQEQFYKHTGFKGAAAHVDDTYGVEVDEHYNVEEILPEVFRAKYAVEINPGSSIADELHLGYLQLWKIKN